MESDARAALEAHHAGELGGAAFLRRLVSFDHWQVLADIGPDGPAPLLDVATGERWLSIYTDPAAASAARPRGGAPGVLEVPGPGLFAGLSEDLAGLRVNPGTPLAIHWRHEQLPTLRRWGRAVEVERLLRGASKAPLAILRDFDGYRVVLRALADGRTQLAMAPDDRGRRLAAVFTAEDTLNAFLAAAADALPSPAVLQLDGQALFERLAAMPLDGIVFNCSGPVPPRAVDRKLAELVLRA